MKYAIKAASAAQRNLNSTVQLHVENFVNSNQNQAVSTAHLLQLAHCDVQDAIFCTTRTTQAIRQAYQIALAGVANAHNLRK